jgi:hypothetical protein
VRLRSWRRRARYLPMIPPDSRLVRWPQGHGPAGVSLARCSAFDSPRSSFLCRWLPIVHPPLAHPNVPLRCCGHHPLGARHCCSETSNGRGRRQPPLAAGWVTKDRSPGMSWVCVRKGNAGRLAAHHPSQGRGGVERGLSLVTQWPPWGRGRAGNGAVADPDPDPGERGLGGRRDSLRPQR